jgi:hypothetical protein
MKKIVRLISLVALTSLLAACHRGHDISVDGHSVTLHVDDQPAATITSRGSFSVGSKLIDVTPDQRQLLIRYYNGVVDIHRGVESLKKAGFAMAGKSLDMAGQSVKQAVGLASDSSTAGKAAAKAMQDKGQQMEQAAAQLCRTVGEVKQWQASIATQIAAFKPYAELDAAPGVHCSSH